MKKAAAIVIGLLSACTSAYAASGDLDVAGNINASGTRLGNPRLGIMGYSGGDYGSVGYGFLPTGTTGQYNYGLNDTASQLRFHYGGFQFRTAPAGTFGSPITWSTPMTITSGGNVGIGTGSPSSPLEVLGNTNWASGWRHGIKITSNDYPTLRLHSLNTAKTSFIGNDNDGGLWFGINGSDTAYGTYGMVIQPTGNVGIGTASPTFKLDVSGDIMTGEWLRVNKSGAGLYNQVHNNYIYTNSGNYWKMASAGNSAGGLAFYQGHESNLRGYVYWDTASFGLLSNDGGYSYRVTDGRRSDTAYGAATIYGSKNSYGGTSYGGVSFRDQGGALLGTLMMHSSVSGFYNSSDSDWRWYVTDSGDQYQQGDIYFSKASPTLKASSQTMVPGGLNVSGGTLSAANQMEARGGIHNDSGTYLELKGGTSGKTKVTGNLVFPDGTEQTTSAVNVLSAGTATPNSATFDIPIPPTTGKINLTYTIIPSADVEPILIGFNDNLTAPGTYTIYTLGSYAAIAGKVHAGYARTVAGSAGQYNSFTIVVGGAEFMEQP